MPPRSPECRAKQSEAAKRRWADPAERKAQSERMKVSAPWKGKHLSEEHRQAISDGGQGAPHHISGDGLQAMRATGVLAMARLHAMPGLSHKLSVAAKKRAKQGTLGFQNHAVWQRGFDTRVLNGSLVSAKSGRGITGFRRGLTHYCRSTLEANFARVLVLEKVPYEYEPELFLLPSGHRWTPDFKLMAPLDDLVPAGWVELKGWRKLDGGLPGEAPAKIAEFEQVYGEHVFVLCQDSLLWAVLEQRYSSRVPLWEKPRRNLRTHPGVFCQEDDQRADA